MQTKKICLTSLLFILASLTPVQADINNMQDTMLTFHLSEIVKKNSDTPLPYLEFLRTGTMSAYLYELPADATDTQTPHDQDEIYYVIEGEAVFTAGTTLTSVKAGTILYVEKFTEHRFSDITKSLRLLVIFAPPDTE